MKTSEITSWVKKELIKEINNPNIIVSEPVIREEGCDYYMACFVTIFDNNDLDRKILKRPTLWVLMDLEASEILEINYTQNQEFSDCSYDEEFFYDTGIRKITSIHQYEATGNILDSVRNELFEKNKLNKKLYKEYLTSMFEDVPKNYRRFYLELGIKA